jgi:hypothetical protein
MSTGTSIWLLVTFLVFKFYHFYRFYRFKKKQIKSKKVWGIEKVQISGENSRKHSVS